MALILLITHSLYAQKKLGLYLSKEDYMNHKISYFSNGQNGIRIKLNEFLGSKFVIVRNEGKKQLIAKSSIFGYSLDNKDYRYFKNQPFRIEDTSGFYLYSSLQRIEVGKWAKPQKFYFFSVKPNSPILSLSIPKLEDEYFSYTAFIDALESSFKADKELSVYDKNHRALKIKYLYKKYAL